MKKTNVSHPRQSRRSAFPAFALFLLISSACSLFPSGTSEPVTGTVQSFKPGFWSHEGGSVGEATVSFNLSEDGTIENFHMTASIGTPKQACTMSVDKTRIDAQKDGSFKISYSMEYADVSAQLGPAVMEVFGGSIPKGKPYEVLLINGKGTGTTMDGTFTITVCGPTLYLGNNTGPWKAEWKNS